MNSTMYAVYDSNLNILFSFNYVKSKKKRKKAKCFEYKKNLISFYHMHQLDAVGDAVCCTKALAHEFASRMRTLRTHTGTGNSSLIVVAVHAAGFKGNRVFHIPLLGVTWRETNA